MKSEHTQQEKVLLMLIRSKGAWIPTFDFQSLHGLFVGHRAPARISELANEFKEMIQTERIEGKRTFKYRLRVENSVRFLPTLPDDMRRLVETEMREQEVGYSKLVREWDTSGKVATPRDVIKTFGYPQTQA